MWPHFFSLASWSSRCTPAAPASIIALINSKTLSGPPKPASASATIGANQSMLVLAFGVRNLVRALQRLVDSLNDCRNTVRRIEALVGIHLPGEIRVRCDLPAAEINCL